MAYIVGGLLFYMKKLVVWFIPEVKNGHNQIHVLANTVNEAVEIATKKIPFKVKIIGVGNFRGDNFINLKIY